MTAEIKAIASNSNWSEVYDLADTYRNQQQWQNAAIAFQRAIELRPDFFWSYHHLGDVFTQLRQWKQAAIAYRRAVQLDPNFFWSWHNLADALTKLKQWEQAAIAYRSAVQLDPNFFWSWHNLADALINLQQWDRAIASYLQAIHLQPSNQLVYQKLGTAFKQRGNLEESIQYYRQVIQSPEPNSIFSIFKTQPQLLLDFADTLTKEHQAIGAIILYYLLLELQPYQDRVLQQLAQLLQQQNQLERNLLYRRQKLESESNSELLSRLKPSPIPKPKTPNLPGRIIVNSDCAVQPNQLEDLCSAVGWSRRPLNRVQQALDNSFSYIAAWHIHNQEQRLIGFARAVSDGTFHATMLDILVHPNFQNRGLGKTIVTNLIEQLRQSGVKDITLFASPHIVDFYHKLGFISQPNNLQWMLWSFDLDDHFKS
ncbi:GNAT family N-acetyltransferase [Pleurocapsa sp. PCC 7319]|uniref:GNAT family N-acetyltransferase n=1 Tax=Pleurocapsa sp. PCC 7319 TaxID=118161 RepID=UPI00034B3394|nr:GNAT family N-acetyltransferase [Pleurocapsa sp. PCC 7319]